MSRAESPHLPTLPAHRGAAEARRARNLRRVGILAMLALVVLGLTGLLGPRTAMVSDVAGGWRLDVRHAQVTRSGQPAPLRLRVTSDRPITEPVTIRLDDDLGDRLDFQNWYPNPAAETGTASYVTYEFDPPGTRVLEVDLDARTAPVQPPSADAYAVGLVQNGAVTANVRFRMWVLP